MELLLKKTIDKLGRIGDVVTVRPGYARNFLLPMGYAVPITKANMAEIESRHDVAALEKARQPSGSPKPGTPEYKAWREAKARYIDAESWRNDRRQVTLLRGGILGSFVIQVAITVWVLLRLLGNVRRRARASA